METPAAATPRPLDDQWRHWLRTNLQQGCQPGPLFEAALRQGFDPAEITAELERLPPAEALSFEDLARAPLTDPAHRPRAWRLDTPLAQIYEIPDLLSPEECQELITAIDGSLTPSTVTRGPSDYRTSRTCHLSGAAPELVRRIDARLAALIGVDEAYSDSLQGQRYDPGQYFRAHTDWFTPGTDEYETHTNPGGQRTWTVMVYLNSVEAGGRTRFGSIGRDFQPVAGLGLAWNNLSSTGEPNPDTLHEALPVEAGRKYVITKWFRLKTGRNLAATAPRQQDPAPLAPAVPTASVPTSAVPAAAVAPPGSEAGVRPPRFADGLPFRLIATPAALQQALLRELATLSFRPLELPVERDREYGAAVQSGISGRGLNAPDLALAPMSQELQELGYATLTPLIEAWAGCPLERSWGYGIRSYGRHSVLHLHRDRVDTHVISCIVHAEDRSDVPWPLDFIDHEGTHHRILFEPGTTLLYESLCPHARLTPFAGEYYRNLYFHWRPRTWDPAPFRGMRCKYPSLEACLAEWS